MLYWECVLSRMVLKQLESKEEDLRGQLLLTEVVDAFLSFEVNDLVLE